MPCPEDKTFSGAGCDTDKSFKPPVDTSTGGGVTTPPDPACDVAENFPHPFGPNQIPPDQAQALGLEVEQFLNEQALALQSVGETGIVYRQKSFGETCACVDPDTNQSRTGCLICFGTRWVGGYDLIKKTAVYIGASPLARKLTEIGLTLDQKPILLALPDVPLRDRDFVVAKDSLPATDVLRIEREPVLRAALDPDQDPLRLLNVAKILKISNAAGGGEDFEREVDFILTGGELKVEDALTAPVGPDQRILRVLGKRAPLDPPDSESPTGETDEVPILTGASGLKVGESASAFNRIIDPQLYSVTLAQGTGVDAAFLIITLDGAAGSGIGDQAAFPAEGFLVTVQGDAILWLPGGNRPADAATYFVSYEAALSVTKRYQIIKVTPHPYQGVVIAQQADIELMDQTHPIYGIRSEFDATLPLDRQVGNIDALRKLIGGKADIVTVSPNKDDPRFIEPEAFFS